jgi:hypothetical protein
MKVHQSYLDALRDCRHDLNFAKSEGVNVADMARRELKFLDAVDRMAFSATQAAYTSGCRDFWTRQLASAQ